MPGYVKDQGAYQEITQPYAKAGGTWVPASKAYTKQGGTWVEWWPGGGEPPVTFTAGAYGFALDAPIYQIRGPVAQDDIGAYFVRGGYQNIYRADANGTETLWAAVDSSFNAYSYAHRAIGTNELAVCYSIAGGTYSYVLYLNGASNGSFAISPGDGAFASRPENLGRTFYGIDRDTSELVYKTIGDADTSRVALAPAAPFGTGAGEYSRFDLYPCASKNGFYLTLKQGDTGVYENRFLSIGGGHVEVMPPTTAGVAPTSGVKGAGAATGDALIAGVTSEGNPIFNSVTDDRYWILEDNDTFVPLTLRRQGEGRDWGGEHIAQVPDGGIVKCGLPVSKTLFGVTDNYGGYTRVSTASLVRTDPRWEVTTFTPPTGTRTIASDQNGTFVAATGQELWTCGDDLNFTLTHTATHDLYYIYHDGTRFVANAQGDAKVVTSLDGLTWETNTVSRGEGNAGFPVSGEGKHIVTVYGADLLYEVSADWLTWTELPQPATKFTITSYGQGRWVGIDPGTGAIYFSTDGGATWTQSGGAGYASTAGVSGAYALGKHFLSNKNGIIESTDGDNWGRAGWYLRGAPVYGGPLLRAANDVIIGAGTAFEGPKVTLDAGGYWEPIPGVQANLVVLSSATAILGSNDFIIGRTDTANLVRARKV